MQVEQAIFSSADNAAMRGYQMVARSPGVDRRLAQELCRWAPSHASLWGESPQDWSLNYFPAGDDWIAVTRTLYGGPEYSRRGGNQVVTMMLAMRLEQFSGYDFNPLAVAKTALALGHLRLQVDAAERLPMLTLPRRPIAPAVARSLAAGSARGGGQPGTSTTRVASPRLAEVLELLESEQRVAVTGIRKPMAAVEELIEWIPAEERIGVSFTTGLKPSIRRAFRLHFLPTADPALRQALTAQGIRCEPAPPKISL